MSTARYSVGISGELRVTERHGAPRPLGRIDVAWDMLSWWGTPRPLVKDLLHIATAVHHIDRIAPRERSGDGVWGPAPRRLDVELRVSEPSHWLGVNDELNQLLHWLTDDDWNLSFHRAQDVRPTQKDCHLERLVGAEELALFSGGLDSLAGAYVRLQENNRPLYLLSSLGTSVRERFQKQACAALDASRYRWMGFRHQLRRHGPLVTPNRTRGFLFLSAAAAAADTLGIQTVATYECGVGALNLPMNGAQIGAQNTRATHPRTLRRLESILRRVLETDLRLELPFLLLTKGELCRRTGDALGKLARASNSCDETERNKKDLREHCGVCTSCLLRRTSLYAAHGDADPSTYRCHETRRNGRYQIDAFHAQARCFAAMNRYQDLVDHSWTVDDAVDYLTARGTSLHHAQEQVLSLFKRHAEEVLSFYQERSPSDLSPRPRRTRTERPHHDLFPETG